MVMATKVAKAANNSEKAKHTNMTGMRLIQWHLKYKDNGEMAHNLCLSISLNE